MPGVSTAESTLMVPARHNIGNPTSEPSVTSALPYVNNSGLTKTNVKTVPRNQSFSKRNRKEKRAESKQEHVDKTTTTAATVNSDNGEDSTFPVSLELTLGQASEEDHKNIKQGNGRNYLQNYKAVLKQRGVKYQEVFGHTPRKPEQRLGRATTKAPILVTSLAKSTVISQKIPRQRSLQDSPVLFQHSKLPRIVTEADLAANANVRFSSPTGKDTMNYHSKTPSDVDFYNGDAFSHGHATTDDEELMTDRFSEALNDYIHVGFTPRRVRKRGKLGEVMTQKKMEELLETGEPLRMENYYNVYD